MARAIHQLTAAGMVQDTVLDGMPVRLAATGHHLADSIIHRQRREFARIVVGMPAAERAALVEVVAASTQADRWYWPQDIMF